jgi:hypothetical protein
LQAKLVAHVLEQVLLQPFCSSSSSSSKQRHRLRLTSTAQSQVRWQGHMCCQILLPYTVDCATGMLHA